PCPYVQYTVLGKGTYGTVCRVRTLAGQQYALKNVRAGTKGLTPTEIDIALRLRHPNLAEGLRVVLREELAPCRAMESFNLGLLMPLYAEIGKPRQPSDASSVWPAPLQMLLQLSRGLAYLHANG